MSDSRRFPVSVSLVFAPWIALCALLPQSLALAHPTTSPLGPKPSSALTARVSNGDSLGLSPFWDWKEIETPNFRIVFPKEVSKHAKRVAALYEEAHEALKGELRWTPKSKINVLLVDNADSANGMTTPISRFGMLLYLTPPDAFFSTDYYDDWLRLLVFHEHAHFLNMDPTRSFYQFTRLLFGDVLLPNSMWTPWMLEGYAVHLETKYTGAGRGRSPYWEGLLRTIVSEKALDRADYITLDQVNGPHPHFPSGEVPYLFGYHLMNTAARQRDGALSELTERSSSRIPFFINGNLENVIGKDWYALWDEWVARSNERMNSQIATIQRHPLSKTQSLDGTDDQSFGVAFSPDGKWTAYSSANKHRWQTLWIREWDGGKGPRKSEDKFSGSSIVFTPDSKRVLYSSLHNYRNYSFFSDLRVHDLATNTTYWLTDGARARDPDVSRDGKWIVFTEASDGGVQLALAKIGERKGRIRIETKRRIPGIGANDRVSNPKFTADTRGILFSWKKDGELQEGIYHYNFEKKTISAVVADGSRNRFPALDAQGRLYFVSDKTGVDNVYRYDSNGKSTLITNVLGGILLPSFRGNDLYASVLSKDGMGIARVETFTQGVPQNEVTVSIGEDAPATISTEEAAKSASSLDLTIRDYSALPRLLPRQWAPMLLSTSTTTYFGAQVFGYDNTFRHQYFAFGAHDTTAKTNDFHVQYQNRSFGPTLTLFASKRTEDTAYTGSPSYPTYARETNFGGRLHFPFQGTISVLTPSIGYRVERLSLYDLPGNDPVLIGRSASVPEIDAMVSYSNTRSSRLAIAPERGSDTLLGVRAYDVGERDIYKAIFKHTRYFNLGNHMVLFPSLKAMKVNRRDFSFFDATSVSRGKRSRLLNPLYGDDFDEFGIRGYPSLTVSSREVVTLSADLRIPVSQIFRGWGTNPLFLKQFYLQLFAEDTYRPSAISTARHLPAAGAGLRLGIDAFLHVPLTLGVDYQRGFNKDTFGQGEVFFSVMSSSLLPF
jgi:hypothetical protein